MNDKTTLYALLFSGLMAFAAVPVHADGTTPTDPAGPTSPTAPSIPPIDDNGRDADDVQTNDRQVPRPGTDGTSTGKGMGTGTGDGTGNDTDTTPRNNGGASDDGGTGGMGGTDGGSGSQ